MIKLTPVTHNNQVATPLSQTQSREPAVKPTASTASPTSTEQTMMQARQTLTEMPEVDLEKVAQVKAALGRGELSFDQDGVTQALQQFFQRSE